MPAYPYYSIEKQNAKTGLWSTVNVVELPWEPIKIEKGFWLFKHWVEDRIYKEEYNEAKLRTKAMLEALCHTYSATEKLKIVEHFPAWNDLVGWFFVSHKIIWQNGEW